MGRCLIAM
jgi:deoxyribonuclease IV